MARRVIPFRPPRTRTVTLPAPTGGWNARDSLESMDIHDAVSLENWWPGTTSVFLRYGYSQFATKSGQHETVMAYNSATTNALFSIAGGSVYNVSAGGAIGAADVSGLTNSRFQYANFTTPANSYLLMVNGADKQQVYTGSAWAKDGDGAPYDITAVNSNTLINVNVFKSRLWYVQKNTLKAWYLPINAIGGAATALDLSGIFQMGGYLMAMGTWTLDAGYGVDDYAVFVTSVGEVAVYRLTDPTTPAGIALVGIWRVGSPIGRRCLVKYGGDLLMISQDGLIPLSGALQSSRLNPRVSLTDKISFAVSSAVSFYGSNFGWQAIAFPKQNQLYLNVPVQEGSTQEQYVMNTITKSWGRFTGWAANCWEIYNDELYFGGNGFIGKAWNTNADNSTAISANALQAFNDMGTRAKKRFLMLKPYLMTSGSPSLLGNINTDFDTSDTTAPLSFTPTTYGTWDAATWDSGLWGQDLTQTAQWQGATAIGFYGATRLKTQANGIQVQWTSTTVNYEEAVGVMI